MDDAVNRKGKACEHFERAGVCVGVCVHVCVQVVLFTLKHTAETGG